MIQLGNPFVGEDELDSVSELIAEGHLSIGDIVEKFEHEFATFTDRKGAAAVCSGSMALGLALQVTELDPGDGIVISPYNCGAVLFEPLHHDLVPIFADIDPKTCSLDPESVRKAISDANVPVKGLLVTHLYGLPADFKELEEIAINNGLTIINDFAQAPGALYQNQPIGSVGDIGICSFGPTKNITTAEGGAVVSDDDTKLSRIKALRSNTGSQTPYPQWSVRMNDIEAAIGLEQLQKYGEILANKRLVAGIYRKRLPADLCLQPEFSDRTDVYHGFPITYTDRDKLAAHLDEGDIMTGTAYDTPLYDYDAVSRSIDPTAYSHTEEISSQILLLPIHANMTPDKAETVAARINDFVSGRTD